MINTILLGYGMVANHFTVGLERIKGGFPPYGVPLAKKNFGMDIKDIKIIASYDVDKNKVGRTAYEIAKEVFRDEIHIPEELDKLEVHKGIHLNSVRGMPIETISLDDEYKNLGQLIDHMLDEWRLLKPKIIVNMLTTEYGKPFNSIDAIENAVKSNCKECFTATQLYAYIAAKYSEDYSKIAFVNVIPVFIANDPGFVSLYEKVGGVVFGDDGATGATPLTADLLEHLADRNRFVKFIVQFNIGGNLDFLALTIPEKNKMKEVTKSSIVKDILGYDAPHYIKPTGYLKPLGDKKYVAMHIEYINFNGLKDELYIDARINDSPSLAGLVVDLIRIGSWALDKRYKGTLYPVNAFFMKKPGPINSLSISKIEAYKKLLEFLQI